ncbi:hypothetical protein BDFG_02210 [Blastomyces dermatitidis ATCC 26199]|nr:hypothetical protein BDFG_02210 [Blastomyces dermatitidis ATCC 26199]
MLCAFPSVGSGENARSKNKRKEGYAICGIDECILLRIKYIGNDEDRVRRKSNNHNHDDIVRITIPGCSPSNHPLSPPKKLTSPSSTRNKPFSHHHHNNININRVFLTYRINRNRTHCSPSTPPPFSVAADSISSPFNIASTALSSNSNSNSSSNHPHHLVPNGPNMSTQEQVRRTNLAAALANGIVSPRASHMQLHPMMCVDGRFPADFQVPRTVEGVLLLDNTQLDRILQDYKLYTDARSLLLTLPPRHRSTLVNARCSSSRFRQAKLHILLEYLGAVRIVEDRSNRAGF